MVKEQNMRFDTVSMSIRLDVLLLILMAPPVLYFVISYSYLASWHNKLFLWNSVIHENGRLTLLESLYYFDHFVGVVPMIVLFALCVAGGFSLGGVFPSIIDMSTAKVVTTILLTGSALIVLFAFLASIFTAGWQRTLDYAFQRIERDGVISKGGTWNQLQISNIPIALGTIGLTSALAISSKNSVDPGNVNPMVGGIICIGLAAVLSITISALNWSGWQSFLNPRWVAHSVREIATYPLTGIPVAMASILLVEYYLSGVDKWTFQLHLPSILLLGTGIAFLIGQLIFLRNVDVLAIAQKPSFASDGLPIPYLLCSHVFEHFLDFVLIIPLSGGVYAFVRFLFLQN
jgi:hypothetical protein